MYRSSSSRRGNVSGCGPGLLSAVAIKYCEFVCETRHGGEPSVNELYNTEKERKKRKEKQKRKAVDKTA